MGVGSPRYRYQRVDPLSGEAWPAMPGAFRSVAAEAAEAAGYARFAPEACLINRYEPGARLSLHQDRDELDLDAPIVSVSLGLPAVFLFGGLRRNDRPRRIRLEHGDVVVWGGSTRLAFHGVESLDKGCMPSPAGAASISRSARQYETKYLYPSEPRKPRPGFNRRSKNRRFIPTLIMPDSRAFSKTLVARFCASPDRIRKETQVQAEFIGAGRSRAPHTRAICVRRASDEAIRWATASLLICVHLRFHFLLPEQPRNRRRSTVVIRGRDAPGGRQSIQQKSTTVLTA